MTGYNKQGGKMEGIKDLRDALRGNTMKKERVCRFTGLSKNSLKRELAVPKKFNLYEIVGIKLALNLDMDEIIKIFAPFVAKYNKNEDFDGRFYNYD